MKKILVTGAAGFIGFHLSKRLLNRGFTVVGLDNINDYYDVRIKYGRLNLLGISSDDIQWNHPTKSQTFPQFRFIRQNLEDPAISDVFKNEQFDIVVNLAAQAGVRYSIQNPMAYVNSNVIGFLNILEGCRHNQVKHLVYASSSSVYGMNEHQILSEKDNVDHPVSLYAATKKGNELTAHCYSHLYQIPTTGLRFFSVYGPWGRPDMALFLFTKAILNNQPIQVFNHGNMVRDFTYVDDIVEGILLVLDKPANGNPGWSGKSPDPSTSRAPYRLYNIGNSKPIPLLTFIEELENHLGMPAEKIMMPMQSGDVERTNADISALVQDFGYKPKTSITEGIKNFVEWYRNYFGQ